jgi:NAD(P)-dependent dehydrogenase (short-subunit alcohol dehydrogenase family)
MNTKRTVLVTGAGSGIGKATALAFAQAGSKVLVVDIDEAAARATAALIAEKGAETAVFSADVSSVTAMEELDRRVFTEHGVMDVAVNNAGIAVAGSFLDTTVDDWQRLLGVNVWGVIHGCRLFARRMVDRGRGGHIVNVASLAAYLPNKALPAYATTKAAVLMLSECLRVELKPHKIGVSAICPGLVDTNITRSAHFAGVSDGEQERLRNKSAALYRRRNFQPEGVARAIVRAVAKNSAVVPVTAEAKAIRLLNRISPEVVRALASLDTLPK